MKLVTFGEIMLRLAPPGYQRFAQARSFDVIYGGGEANVAVSAANYGIDVDYVTRLPANDLGDAIAMVNRGGYGNMACIFTGSGSAARRFRNEADAGNIGINIGVAAPMAFFPFSGWNDSFFGDLHAQGSHAVEFYTQTKIVVERWPGEWSRKF